MIPANEKDILLLPVTDGGVTNPFNMPGFPGYNSKKAKHNGLDIGWVTTQNCNILACQDGTVVFVGYSDSIGYGVALQHDYSDGSHRWTAYIHLKEKAAVKKGDFVKRGQKIGIRGGSPYVNGKQKYGTHLHLYVSNVNKKAYTWETMKANVLDPFPLLYLSKAVKYNWINADLRALPYLEDVEKNDDVELIKEENQKLQKELQTLKSKTEKLELLNNGLRDRIEQIKTIANEP